MNNGLGVLVDPPWKCRDKIKNRDHDILARQHFTELESSLGIKVPVQQQTTRDIKQLTFK